MASDTINIEPTKYNTIIGILFELGGMLSEIAIKNIVIESRVLTPILILSSWSVGKKKLRNPTNLVFFLI